jgi:hypothetical protein
MAGLGVVIGGSNASQYVRQGSLRVEWAQGQRAIAYFDLVSPDGSYRPQLGQTIGIYLGDNIYGGTIDQIEETGIGNGSGRSFRVSCVSWEQRYDKRYLTKTYQSTNCGTIFADLVSLTGEINNSAPDIQNGAGVDLLVLDAAQVSSVFSDLATRSGYIWGITADQSAFFVPRAAYEAPGPLDSSNILRGQNNQWYPSIRSTREQLQNAEWRRIARTALSPEVETFTGDGSNQTFNADHPIALIPEGGIKVNGTPVDFGPNTDTEIAWRVTYGTTLFTQREDGTPLTSSDTLEITYYKVGGDLIEHTDHTAVGAQQAIEGGGSGRYEKFVDDTTNTDAGSALAAAQADVAAFKVAPVEVTVYTRLTGYLPGQIVGITLPSPHSAFTGEYLINQVTMQHEAGDGSGTDDFCLFEIKAISTTYLGGYRQFFRDLTGTGGGAPISATITGTGGSTGSPSAPAAATLTAIDILGYHTDGPEGGTQHRSRRDATYIRLGLRGSLPAGAKGVWILGEEPDTSGSALTRGVAGSVVAGDGTVASGALQPRDYGHRDFVADSPYLAMWSVRAPVETSTYRYYAVTYSEQVEGTFVPANQAGASPSLTKELSPEPIYTSGEEYAPNALSLTAEAHYQLDNNVWSYYLDLAWSEPTTHPRWDALTGYTIAYEYEDGTFAYQDVERGETSYSTDVWPVSDGASTIVVWLRSKGLGGLNRIVKGVTPSATVVVQRPTDSAGQEYAPLVTGVYASIVKSQTQDGVEVYHFEFGWVQPDERVGQVHVFVHETVGDSWHDIGTFAWDDIGPHATDKWPVANGSANFTMYFYSVSRDGKENTHSDSVTPKVTGLSLTASGSGTLKATRLTLFKNTEFEIVGGEFRVKNVDFTKAMPGTFDSSNFDISGGLWKIANSGVKETNIQAGAVTTLKLTTNAIDVGGGGGKPIQFRVFNALGALTGWIGHDTGSGFDGAWFKRCFIGGTSPADAKIIADANGNVAISGNLIVGAVAQATSASSATTALNYGGTIQCSQLVAGTMTSTGPSAGIGIAYGSNASIHSPQGIVTQAGSAVSQITAQSIAMTDSFLGVVFVVNSSGIVNARGYQINGVTGLTTVVSYRKADGVSNGTLTFTGGWLTGQT